MAANPVILVSLCRISWIAFLNTRTNWPLSNGLKTTKNQDLRPIRKTIMVRKLRMRMDKASGKKATDTWTLVLKLTPSTSSLKFSGRCDWCSPGHFRLWSSKIVQNFQRTGSRNFSSPKSQFTRTVGVSARTIGDRRGSRLGEFRDASQIFLREWVVISETSFSPILMKIIARLFVFHFTFSFLSETLRLWG